MFPESHVPQNVTVFPLGTRTFILERSTKQRMEKSHTHFMHSWDIILWKQFIPICISCFSNAAPLHKNRVVVFVSKSKKDPLVMFAVWPLRLVVSAPVANIPWIVSVDRKYEGYSLSYWSFPQRAGVQIVVLGRSSYVLLIFGLLWKDCSWKTETWPFW